MHPLLNGINEDPQLFYIIIRSILIYGYAILLFRLFNPRFKLETIMDYLLAIILGSIFAKSINASIHFSGALISGLILILTHWLFAKITFTSDRLGKIIKGSPSPLMLNGKMIYKNMKKHQVTRQDLEVELHRQMHIKDLSSMRECYLERTGKISFIK